MISYDTLLPQAKSLKHTAFYICPTQAFSIFNEFLLNANQQTRQNRIQTWRRLATPSRSLQSKYQLLSDSSHIYPCIMLLSSTPTPLWGFHWSPLTSWCFPFLCCPCPPDPTCLGHRSPSWSLLLPSTVGTLGNVESDEAATWCLPTAYSSPIFSHLL